MITNNNLWESLPLETKNLILAKAAQYYRENDKKEEYSLAAQKLVLNNLALSSNWANKTGRGYLEPEDRFQEANLGQLESIQDLDYNLGSYETHAKDHIKKRISKASYHALRAPLSQDVFQRRGMIKRAERELTQKLGRVPNEIEVADFVNEQNPHLKTKKIRPYQVRRLFSANKHLEPQNSPGINLSIPDSISYKQMIERVRKVLHGDTLKSEEKKLIIDHYGFCGERKSLTKMANERSVTRAAVSKQHVKILDKLREALVKEFKGNIEDLVAA